MTHYAELLPSTYPYGNPKSFYGKAILEIDTNADKTLISYTTRVCKIDAQGNFEKLWNGYSATTMRHINAFRIENSLDPLSKKEWENM